MIVIDASVLARIVGDDHAPGDAARRRVATERAVVAPDLVDPETVSALRREWLAGKLTPARFAEAIDDLRMAPVDRHPMTALLHRAFELRENVTPYDAMYVALAEAFDCPLVTADARLAQAPGPRCQIELLA